PQGRGYVKLAKTAQMPWTMPVTQINAHEFHYASLDNLPNNTPNNYTFAYDVLRGTGISGNKDGIVINNLMANFCHLRNTASCPWVENFVEFVRGSSKS
ncbi:MAG: cobyrinic acid a,c-diamide synthase, partial [Gammaproteobacteria bacterium]